MSLNERFEKFNDEFLKFELIDQPDSPRRDLHAFLLLDKLVPGKGPIVSASEHDEYFLDIDCDALDAAATDEQICELVRCGIRYSGEYECLCVFS